MEKNYDPNELRVKFTVAKRWPRKEGIEDKKCKTCEKMFEVHEEHRELYFPAQLREGYGHHFLLCETCVGKLRALEMEED